MERFAELIAILNNTTRTNDKRDALIDYYDDVPDEDKLWLTALFTGRRPKRLVNSTLMKVWCMEVAHISPWLFDECYHTVGDLSEAIALMLPPAIHEATKITLTDLMLELKTLQTADELAKQEYIINRWKQLPRESCIIFNKLMMGGFRIGVSEAIVIQALAKYLEKDPQAVAHLISGNWDPYATTFGDLIHENVISVDQSKPYPFYLAYGIEGPVSNLGDCSDWQVEWKWDGIRGQLIRRSGNMYLWSRGEDLITDRFPELEGLKALLPDGIALDGEILSYRHGLPLSFQYLQTRITRKTVSKKQIADAPVIFMTYDLLEYNGQDMRITTQAKRRALLESIIAQIDNPHLVLSPLVQFNEWDELGALMYTARERGCEGFMLKRKESIYQAGRRRGDWWKWKIDPMSVDAVMIYAQKGHGKRSNLYTDYTFAVRDGDKLISFAKAYSGLTDKEINRVDAFVKRHSVEQFGPVRTVEPKLVFEIGFEGISASARHKSGVAVRFPRILRWREDKMPDEINTIEDLQQLLDQYGKMG
jgi:DNA ligase-1